MSLICEQSSSSQTGEEALGAQPTMRSSNVLTMMPSGSDVASRAISFLTVLKNFFASAGRNSIFLNE